MRWWRFWIWGVLAAVAGSQALSAGQTDIRRGQAASPEPLAGFRSALDLPPVDENWEPERTAWGDPDLQGIWNGKTTTPLERPDEYADREFLTDEEVLALEVEAATEPGRDARATRGSHEDVEGAYNDVFTERVSNVVRTKRTSLIVDPPDGKIPALTETEQKRRSSQERRGRTFDGHYFVDTEHPPADNPEDRHARERCLGVTLPITDRFMRIVQGSGQVMIYYEFAAQGGIYRTILLDGQPHLPVHIRQWLGDSRGHWEGNTLVVDTTNFSNKTSYRGSGENLHLVERITRVGADMIMYEITVGDPTVWTRPWTMEVPLTMTDNKQNRIFESACHEGNYAMTTMLAGARFQEREAAAQSPRHN